MKKKIFSYLVVGTMALSLVACSGKAELSVNSPVQEEQADTKNVSDVSDELEYFKESKDSKEQESEVIVKDKEVIVKDKIEDINKEEEEKNSKTEVVTKVVSNTIERPEASNSSTKKPSTKKPSTKKPSTKKPSTSKPSTSKPSTSKPVKKATLLSIHSAVKKAYGNNYIPRMSIDEEMLEEQFGIKSEWYTDIIGEGPMMSTHVDTFIAVQANKKNVNDVVKALEQYRNNLINDSIQYPMNLPKINASQVLKVDNNVFFIMLGAIPDDTEESEEALLDAAKTQNQIAVKAIKKAMKK